MPSKKSKLHLYADECIPIPSIIYLKKKGISVVHAYDINFVKKPDIIHLKKSKQLNRILLSLDKDFKKFKEFSLQNHPGVILISTGDVTPESINKILDKSFKHVTESSAKDSLTLVTIDKIIRERDGEITKKTI